MAGKKAVFGIYPDRTSAENAVDALKAANFRNTDISVLLPESAGTKDFAHEKSTKAPEGATTGVGAGALLGGGLGWLVGIGALAIPGLGPFIAAGPIMAALAGAGVGGAVGGVGLALHAPGYSVRDLNDLLDGELFSGEILFSKTRSTTMKDLGLKFAIPIFFFEGTEDFTTPTELARQYLQAIQAPRKEFVPVPGGHFVVFINSDEFLKQLVAHVAPLAERIKD